MDVTDDTFQAEVLDRSHDEPVVVDFWADWCGPCKALAPVLEEKTAAKGVRLVKLDVDANQRIAREYDVSGIPAVKAFRNGNVVAEFVGAQPPLRVESFLDEITRPPVAARLDDTELKVLLESGNYEGAFEVLLARIDSNPEQRDEIRALMVELFGELGLEHPVASTYRKRLAALLF